MKKRLLLILLISFVIFTPSVLAESELSASEEIMRFEVSNEVSYIKASSNSKGTVEGKQICDGIYLLENGDYITYTGTEYYQSVDLYQINLRDAKQIEDLKTIPNISIETLERVIDLSRENKDFKSENQTIDLYLPKYVDSKENEIKYYKYEGFNLKDEIIVRKAVGTSYVSIKTGPDTYNVLGIIREASIYVGSQLIKEVGIIGGGYTILESLYHAFHWNQIDGDTDDYYEVEVIYDHQEKRTYVEKPYYYSLAVVSSRVTVTNTNHNARIYIDEDGVMTGKGYKWSESIRSTTASPHWFNPWMTAIHYNVGTPPLRDNPIYYKVYRTKINLR